MIPHSIVASERYSLTTSERTTLDEEGKRLMIAARRAYGADLEEGRSLEGARKAFEYAVAFIRMHYSLSE